jgi:hypothetical protein
MPLEPGTLIPVDNPQTDVYFPNLRNANELLAAQEEQALQVQIDRLSSMSDLNYGILQVKALRAQLPVQEQFSANHLTT